MKKSTKKYLLYGVGAYVLLASGLLGAGKVQSYRRDVEYDRQDYEARDRSRLEQIGEQDVEIRRLKDFIDKQDRAFQNYLTHLESRLNNFPYNLRQSSQGPVKITKGKSGHPGFPFYITASTPHAGLVQGETHIDRWASDISWTY